MTKTRQSLIDHPTRIAGYLFADIPCLAPSPERLWEQIERAGYKEIMQWESFDRMPGKEADGERWILPSRGFLMERQKEKY